MNLIPKQLWLNLILVVGSLMKISKMPVFHIYWSMLLLKAGKNVEKKDANLIGRKKVF